MREESLIINALTFAQSQGCQIRRGPIFDWVDPNDYRKSTKIPAGCNADGAILLTLGLQESIRDCCFWGWMKPILDYLSCNEWWWFKFCAGFDRGNELTIIHQKDKDKKTIEIDAVSRMGNKLAKRFTRSHI